MFIIRKPDDFLNLSCPVRGRVSRRTEGNDMDNGDEIFQFLSNQPSVITSTDKEEESRIVKMSALGGIPTKVIKRCKTSPVGSAMIRSTCSSIESSDSEEEVVFKKPSIDDLIEGVHYDEVSTIDDASQTIMEPIRTVPLRPVLSMYLITHNQDNYSTDDYAPETPELIESAHPGIKICLDNIQVPPIRTIAEAYDENQRRMRLKELVLSEKYRIVWHSTPLEGYGEDGLRYTVPFTVDKSNILLRGTQTSIPMDTATKTLEFALQRAQSITDLRECLLDNAPTRRIRSSIIRSHRNRNDNRIVSTHRHRYQAY
ncbi:unnamed protein product [Caenorhabditis brenneri]